MMSDVPSLDELLPARTSSIAGLELDAEALELLERHIPNTLAILRARKSEAQSLLLMVIEDYRTSGLDQRRPVLDALAQVRAAESELRELAELLASSETDR